MTAKQKMKQLTQCLMEKPTNWMPVLLSSKSMWRNHCWFKVGNLMWECGLYWLLTWNFSFSKKGILGWQENNTQLLGQTVPLFISPTTPFRNILLIMDSFRKEISCLLKLWVKNYNLTNLLTFGEGSKRSLSWLLTQWRRR